jgi:hypothetical protein
MGYNDEQMIIEAVKRELANMVVPLTAGGIYVGKRSGERLFALVADGEPFDAAQLPAAFVRTVADETAPDAGMGASENLRLEIHLALGALSAEDRRALIFLRNLVFETFDEKREIAGIAGHFITEVKRGEVLGAQGARPALRSVVTLEIGLFKAQ